jgi:hypothetical protein
MRLAAAVRRVTGCDGLNIIVNSGAAAGQDEPHYHVHIIPRRHGDGFDVQLPFAGSAMPDRTLLDAMAARLIAAMSDPMRTDKPGGSTAEKPSGRAAESPSGRAAEQEPTRRATEPNRRAAYVEPSSRVTAPRRAASPRAGEGAHGELTWGDE